MELKSKQRSKLAIIVGVGVLSFAGLVLIFLLRKNGYLKNVLYSGHSENAEISNAQKISKNALGNNSKQISEPVNSSIKDNKTLVSKDKGSIIQATVIKSKPITKNNTRNKSKEYSNSSKSILKGIPELLGQVRIAQGENLWNMMGRIYNTPKPKLLNRVVSPELRKANKQIKNFDDISISTPIRFPIIPRLVTKAPQGCWLSFYQSKDLSKSYNFYRRMIFKNEINEQNLAFVPTWSAKEGLNFYVLYAEPYTTLEEASLASKDLLPSLSKSSNPVNWKDKKSEVYILSEF